LETKNAKVEKEHVDIQHNQVGRSYPATEKEMEFQMLRKFFLIDQYHLNPTPNDKNKLMKSPEGGYLSTQKQYTL